MKTPHTRVLELLEQIASAAVALHKEIAATGTALGEDRWRSQRESPLPSRTHIALARAGISTGDPRCGRRGRLYFLRESLIEQELRGRPRPEHGNGATEQPDRLLTSAEKLRHRLDAQRAARRGGES